MDPIPDTQSPVGEPLLNIIMIMAPSLIVVAWAAAIVARAFKRGKV